MTLHEIIQDIHGLDAELAQLEKRYGLLSADFYHPALMCVSCCIRPHNLGHHLAQELFVMLR